MKSSKKRAGFTKGNVSARSLLMRCTLPVPCSEVLVQEEKIKSDKRAKREGDPEFANQNRKFI